MPGPPILIVTLPARDIGTARSQATLARDAGAHVAEVRLDRLPREELTRLADLFPAPLPLLATLRSRAEGGEGPDLPAERDPILEAACRLPFAFVDREIQRDRARARSEVGDSGERPYPSEIHSIHLHHLPERAELGRWLRTPPGSAVFVKVVAPADLSEVWNTVLPELPPAGERSIVLHTTGPSGALLRALAADLGMAAVFCALPEPAPPVAGRSGPVDPSQIPVDRMHRHVDASGEGGPRFAVLGHPIGHSRSPWLHSRWIEQLDQAGLYIALDVRTESEFVETVPALAGVGFRGVNVTQPWKEAALALADSATPSAERCGCANTLSLDGSDVLAENTDLMAVLRRLDELRAAGTWDGGAITVVGSGGAARAALAAANELGCPAYVCARNLEKAEILATTFHARRDRPAGFPPPGLLLNATPCGRAGAGPLDVDLSTWLGAGGHVVDFVQRPEDPFLARAATQAGATYEDGTRLLAYQAAASFEIWWGMPVPGRLLERSIGDLG